MCLVIFIGIYVEFSIVIIFYFLFPSEEDKVLSWSWLRVSSGLTEQKGQDYG